MNNLGMKIDPVNVSNKLVIKTRWDVEFNCGFIQITKQDYKLKNFFKNSDTFHGKNGITLISAYHPEYSVSKLLVRGMNSTRDHDVVVINDKNEYLNILKTIDEYNEENLDYVDLHKNYWLLIANGLDKSTAMQVMINTGSILPHQVPHNDCFLCQDAMNGNRPDCGKCKGFFGILPSGEKIKCCNERSYYFLWNKEQDLDLKNALAVRIAYNTLPENQR